MNSIELTDAFCELTPISSIKPLQSRLEASLAFRASHHLESKKLVPTLDFPDENSESHFHPRRTGLFCDAPLGLKY